jgi:hypothetical protein
MVIEKALFIENKRNAVEKTVLSVKVTDFVNEEVEKS